MAKKVFSMSAFNCCPWRGNDGGEEGVLDVHAVVLPRGRMLMAKRAFSASMTDRRGPLGADDDGEEGVQGVRLRLVPRGGMLMAKRAFSTPMTRPLSSSISTLPNGDTAACCHGCSSHLCLFGRQKTNVRSARNKRQGA